MVHYHASPRALSYYALSMWINQQYIRPDIATGRNWTIALQPVLVVQAAHFTHPTLVIMSRNSIWCGFLGAASCALPINIMLAFPICSDARKTSTSRGESMSLSLSPTPILMTLGRLPVHSQCAVVFDIAHCCLRTFCMLPRAAIICCRQPIPCMAFIVHCFK